MVSFQKKNKISERSLVNRVIPSHYRSNWGEDIKVTALRRGAGGRWRGYAMQLCTKKVDTMAVMTVNTKWKIWQ